jgi:glutathione synthase/RimK-type ligase-like ATP-grasp enzyme
MTFYGAIGSTHGVQIATDIGVRVGIVILIVSDRQDIQIYYVIIELEKLGKDWGLLSVVDFPTTASITQQISDQGSVTRFCLEDGRIVDARSVTAVWYRKPALPRLHENVAPHEREFAFLEARATLNSLYDALNGAFWISPPASIRAAADKPGQLRRACAVGLSVPRTLLTNDPAEARAFHKEMGGTVVYKPVGSSALIEKEGSWDEGRLVGTLYCTELDASMFESAMSRLDACPGYFQERIAKRVELRVTIVGDTVFAAEIELPQDETQRVNWRRGDIFKLKHRVHALPDKVADQCRALLRGYGLQFGAVDMILTPEGRYVFLEINANGQYGWIEALTPLEISRAIARLLSYSS